jgi:GGDEF domain-containing protein
MVMDLDSFKEINDNHGHHVGDRALCEVARVLRAAIRPYDICVRYAGDEFIVVLSGCGADEAEHKRQELQKSIDEVYFEARPGKRLQLGISVGARSSRRTASPTKRCSPRPTAGCIRTSRAASAAPGRENFSRTSASVLAGNTAYPELSDLDIQRAAAGIL